MCVVTYRDDRGWKYRVMAGIGENSWKARNQRTTISLPDGSWFIKNHNGENVPWDLIPPCIYGALCKLHDYEKTGLTPSDVEQLLWKE